MAHPYTPRPNDHVHYFAASTARPRAATIVSVGSANGGIVIRINHSGATFGDATTGILREPFNHSATKANTWQVY